MRYSAVMAAQPDLHRQLGLLDGVAVVAGTIIGAGIFLVPNLVAQRLPSDGWILAVWIFSGLLSFFGALACAELGAMMPSTGGHYVWLREIYGPLAAFVCGWTNFVVIMSGAVAWLAVSFAVYLGYFLPMSPATTRLSAVALIAVLTAVNYRGVQAGAAVQKFFTLLKVLGLAVLIGAAFLFGNREAADSTASFDPAMLSQFGAAMIACLLTYDGWIALAMVAGEVREPQRTLPRALALGLGLCVAIYLLANAAYLHVLSPAEIAAAPRVGAAAAERSLGSAGAALVSGTILLSIIGGANGWMLTAPRLYFAQARDGLLFDRFARVHPRFGTPAQAVLLQGVWAAALVLTGSYTALAAYAMFAAWLFYGLTVLGVVILRRRDPDRPRPFRLWGSPITPLLFCAVAFGFVINTLITTPGPALAGAGLIAAGIPIYYLRKKWR